MMNDGTTNDTTQDMEDATPAEQDAPAPQTTADDTPDGADTVETLRAKLEARTGETIKLRKRAQEAETQLAALQAEAREWQAASCVSSAVMLGIVPDARPDVLAKLDAQQLARVYQASKLDLRAVADSPAGSDMRRTFDAARRILDANVKPYMRGGSASGMDPATLRAAYKLGIRGVMTTSTPDLARAMQGMNAMNVPKSDGGGNPLARAIQRQ